LRRVKKPTVRCTDETAKQNDLEAKAGTAKETDDLEMIGGTSEDDFSEAIALIRSFAIVAAF
jgi:hypothetical protein